MQVPWGHFDPVDNVRAFHLGWHFSFSSVRTTALGLLDPVFTMVRAAPTPEVEPLGVPVRISTAA